MHSVIKTRCIIFSRDRALQLDGTLRSLTHSCTDAEDLDIIVLYHATSVRHQRAYQTLAAEHAGHGGATFIEEYRFHEDVINAITGTHAVLFVVDDTIFISSFNMHDLDSLLERHPRAIGFSLRLGDNIRYCYPFHRAQRMPSWSEPAPGYRLFRWIHAGCDFGYPLELSSSLYRTSTVLEAMTGRTFSNPNELEAILDTGKGRLRRSHAFLLSSTRSLAFSNPINTVQHAFTNRTGTHDEADADRLASLFLDGARMDIHPYRGFVPVSCHQEMPLFLTTEEQSRIRVPSSPSISVLMPYYNAQQHVAEAVRSILSQTFSDFELIIIDDGSSDKAATALEGICDPRIEIYTRERNAGVADALNFGLHRARGHFIARHDADDISLPTRLEQQWNWMRAHPECNLCGSWMTTASDHRTALQQYPLTHEGIAHSLLFGNSIPGPTVMVSKDLLDFVGGYTPGLRFGEDFDLLLRLLGHARFGNLPLPLMQYRVHTGQLTAIDGAEHFALVRGLYLSLFNRLKLHASSRDLALHFLICHWAFPTDSLAVLDDIHNWLSRLLQSEGAAALYNVDALRTFLAERFFFITTFFCGHGIALRKRIATYELHAEAAVSSQKRVVQYLRSVMRMPPRRNRHDRTFETLLELHGDA